MVFICLYYRRDYYVIRYIAFTINEDTLSKEDEEILEEYLKKTDEETREYIIERIGDYFVLLASHRFYQEGPYKSFVREYTRLGKTVITYPEIYIKEISEEIYFNTYDYRYGNEKHVLTDHEKDLFEKLSFGKDIKFKYIEQATDG
jgi:hypothetical protein